MNKTTNTDGLKHTTRTAIAISDAAMSGGGDYRATVTALARFCTEALVDAATAAYVPAKFSSDFPKYREATRDEAIARLCGWVSYTNVMAWGADARAERAFSDSFVPSEDMS